MNDFGLHYIEQGTGTPLILLHGNGEDCTYFAHQIEYFSRDYHVYAIDTRGHGKSPRGTAPFTLSQFADDLLVFLVEQALEKADILGFSDGGNIALLFALRYPHRVNRLILCGANIFPEGVERWAQEPIEIEYAELCKANRPEDRRTIEQLGLMINEPHIAPGELKKLTMPTLVMAGDRDVICPDHTRLIADSLPNSYFTIIPGDHFIANNNPVAFNDAVQLFFNETNPRQE